MIQAHQFVNNDPFRDCCVDLIEKMSDTAQERQSAASFGDNITYYSHHLQDLSEVLDDLAADDQYCRDRGDLEAHLQPFVNAGANGRYSIVTEALTGDTGAELLAVPAMQFDLIAFAYDRHRQANNPGAARAQLVWDQNSAAMTFANEGMRRVRENFEANVTEICNRIANDWDNIQRVFFGGPNDLPALRILKLLEIKSSGSDPHKGGKQTYLMKLRAGPRQLAAGPMVNAGAQPVAINAPVGGGQGHAAAIGNQALVNRMLVYKCADLELDTRLVGDTQSLQLAQNLQLPDLALGSLAEIINQLPPAAERIPTYRILPINAGSLQPHDPTANKGPNAASDAAIQLQNSYGYIEFLSHGPVLTQHQIPVVANMADADVLTDDVADCETYLRDYAWAMVMANITGMGDQHKENVLMHRKRLHMIDAEISFKRAGARAGETGVHEWLGDTIEIGKHHCCLFWEDHGDFVHAATAVADAPAFVRGEVQAAFNLVAANPLNIRAWLTDPELAKSVARITILATVDYGVNRANFWTACAGLVISPNNNAPQLPADIGQFPAAAPLPANAPVEREPFTWREQVVRWRRAGEVTRNWKDYPYFALRHPDNDFECYLNCDYPCHYHRLGSLDLLNARGQPIRVHEPYQLAAIMNPAPNDHAPRELLGRRFFQSYGRTKRFELVEQDITDADIDNQGLAVLQPHFLIAGCLLVGGANIARVAGAGPAQWQITEPPIAALANGVHGHEWRVIRENDGRIHVYLVRANRAQADLALFQGMNFLQETGDRIVDVPNMTPQRLDTNPRSWMRDVLQAANIPYHVAGRMRRGQVPRIEARGQRWTLQENDQSCTWVANVGTMNTRVYLGLRRSHDGNDRPPIHFAIPTRMFGNAVQAEAAANGPVANASRVRDIFQQNGINLANNATWVRGRAERTNWDGMYWQIRDPAREFVISEDNRDDHRVKVTEVGTAIEAAVAHFDRVVNDAAAHGQEYGGQVADCVYVDRVQEKAHQFFHPPPPPPPHP